jgi:hypothetical protein
MLGCSIFSTTHRHAAPPQPVSISVRLTLLAVLQLIHIIIYGKEESQTTDAHFQSSSVFLIVLHKRIILLIRLLSGLMPEPN